MAKKLARKSAKKPSRSQASGPRSRKYVYFFGNKKADGNRSMKDLLGGKGSGLAEMTNAAGIHDLDRSLHALLQGRP
jgi:pyruvate,orthophosphate dikinase